MSNDVKDAINDWAIGVGIIALLVLMFVSYPCIIISISIVENDFNWLYDHETDEFLFGEEAYASACLWGVIIYGILLFSLIMAVIYIRFTWGFLIGLYLICAYPFYQGLCWMYSGDPFLRFPGIDWVPWW